MGVALPESGTNHDRDLGPRIEPWLKALAANMPEQIPSDAKWRRFRVPATYWSSDKAKSRSLRLAPRRKEGADYYQAIRLDGASAEVERVSE